MKWKHKGPEYYERSCRHCGGTGMEYLRHYGACNCYEHWSNVEHPANDALDPNGYIAGIAKKVLRCDHCGLFWLYFYETSEDSWDVPAPECLGQQLPPDNWRPGAKT